MTTLSAVRIYILFSSVQTSLEDMAKRVDDEGVTGHKEQRYEYVKMCWVVWEKRSVIKILPQQKKILNSQ